ncbi:pectinesterase family protein [Massilia cavernae]|uniref:Pectate lyase domain-containing protein n=1 Tax=Massilia cavernae TaxID=2320864 RepID=A0A418XEC7_9BURK|nr:pectinesterase family protein [Massilia cavernae]RJG10740.1 hypothetical protein D3872_21695 [Massilia cavernae]
MSHRSLHLFLLAALMGGSVTAHALPASAPAREGAPADGWAGQQGGTRGGGNASLENIVTVSDAAGLRAALKRGGKGSRIIQVSGSIDMAEPQPFASTLDQAARGTIRLPSNTTLIGLGDNAGLVNANVRVANASQVIIRNLRFRNPCDVGPKWDPSDGARGNWNAQFDSIAVSASSHVWIDHNSFTDAPLTDDTLARENGKVKQCHDGALDITDGADLVTVSYNHFALHEKNILVGSSDNAGRDAGRLRVSMSNNLFTDVSSRAPRVRFGQVHLFNNYYAGDRRHPAYGHDYSVGLGKLAQLISHQNAFDIAGARGCADIVRQYDKAGAGFTDTGSMLNGAALGNCAVAHAAAWQVPYAFGIRPAASVKAHVLANAGAGKLRDDALVAACPTRDFLLCEGFERNGADGWELAPESGASLAVGYASGGNRLMQLAGPVRAFLKAERRAPLPPGDAFVEARIRPSQYGAGGLRQLYLMGRYVDERNWVGAGVDLPEGGSTVYIQLVRMHDGVLSRLKRVPRARAADGRFSTMRLEMAETALAVYLDGEKITTAPQPAFAGPQGRIGIYSNGGGFELDDLRLGVPGVQPARLAPALTGNTVTAQAGDPPLRLAISAVASDGFTRLPFTARSSNPAVATVSAGADGIIITPKAPGVASAVIASTADPTAQTTIDATVTPAFAMPAQRYNLAGAVSPGARSTGVPTDTVLRIAFDQPPTLGKAGSVRIFRTADDALVDIIRTGEEIGAIGYPGQARSRYVRHTPIKVDGNTVTIKPHGGKLAYGTDYYVAADNGVFNDATLGGRPFAGIGKNAGWSFRTKAAAPVGSSITVDDDGPADFRTVQGALNHAMSRFPKAAPVTINVRNGKYEELLFILARDNLAIRGESRDGVVIHAANSDGTNPGSGVSQAAGSPSFSGGRSLLMIEEADMITLDTLTLRNTTLRSQTRSAQAETVYFNSDSGRLIAKNASFFSEQDTIQVKGYAWFHRTLIEGNVDFIWGANRAALFEDSELRSVGDSANPESGGYVVQARTVDAGGVGFVFLNSALTHGPGPGPKANGVPAGTTYLARSPGTASTWDNVSYINCRMGNHIAAIGWAGSGVNLEPAPNPAVADARRGWREFGSIDLAGNPIDLAKRSGGYALSAAEAKEQFGSRAVIFAGYGNGSGWSPD